MQESIFKILRSKIKNGAITKIVYGGEPRETLKAYQGSGRVVKITTQLVRLGICNANKARNKDKVLGPLNGVEWVTPNDTLVNAKGELQLRCNIIDGKKPHTVYYFDGKEVAKEWLVENKIIGDRKSQENKEGIFNISVKKIIQLGGALA